MSLLSTLITDRTQADVAEARSLETAAVARGWANLTAAQRAAYLAGQKGAYSYVDLNRVGNVVAELAELLAEEGIQVDVSPKTNWGRATPATPALLETYLENVRRIRSAVSSSAPLPASMDKLTWRGANQIEAALAEAYRLTPQARKAYLYAGEAVCGEE